MEQEQFNALYSVWKELCLTEYSFFVRVATCCSDASLRYYCCEYCTQECLRTSEPVVRQFTATLLELLAQETVEDRAEHLLALLEHLLCKLSVLVASGASSHSQTAWKSLFSISLPPTTATVSINGVSCSLLPLR